MNAPLSIPKNAEAVRDLEWWISERERQGTDWKSLLLGLMRAAGLIAPCPVCEREPCSTPSFCQACREVDAKAAAERRNDPRSRARPTPNVTIEAIKQAVRGGGVAALRERATRERLLLCDRAARAHLDRWISNFKKGNLKNAI
jgi:hypothetical protein